MRNQLLRNDTEKNMLDNDKIKVSVYCLAYNHEKYIRSALEGFVNQKTAFRYEVIIHDDCSQDGTADIIRKYAEEYPDIIKPIFETENQYSKGVSIRDIFLEHANGKYVAFCEGDDYWIDPLKLQKQYDALEEHPECSMSTHTVKCVNEDGSPSGRAFPEYKKQIHPGVITQEERKQMLWIRGGV